MERGYLRHRLGDRERCQLEDLGRQHEHRRFWRRRWELRQHEQRRAAQGDLRVRRRRRHLCGGRGERQPESRGHRSGHLR